MHLFPAFLGKFCACEWQLPVGNTYDKLSWVASKYALQGIEYCISFNWCFYKLQFNMWESVFRIWSHIHLNMAAWLTPYVPQRTVLIHTHSTFFFGERGRWNPSPIYSLSSRIGGLWESGKKTWVQIQPLIFTCDEFLSLSLSFLTCKTWSLRPVDF